MYPEGGGGREGREAGMGVGKKEGREGESGRGIEKR